LLLALTLVVIATPGVADEADKLKALRGRIDALQRGLDESRDARDRVQVELRDTEREIGRLLRELRQLDRALKTETARFEQVRAQAKQRRAELGSQIAGLGNDVRSAQVMGRQDYLKLLLNQQDPAAVSRALVYYRYLTKARARRIAEVRGALAQLGTLEQQVEQRRQSLEALRLSYAQDKRRVEQARGQRKVVLAKLNRGIESKAQDLDRLRKDERRLAQLIDNLERYRPEPLPLADAGSFAELRGRLPLPVSSGHKRGRGAIRAANARWKGVFLPVAAGQDVRAVYRGRVAYADWLPGFGLLMILEHGGGYMTLYGYNQSLYKSVGDWVEAGQAIAMSGNTGGSSQAGVYFELRHNGEPRDPLQWFKH
jgi:septal ring factor EnvC (AmiA/AmiB activator)